MDDEGSFEETWDVSSSSVVRPVHDDRSPEEEAGNGNLVAGNSNRRRQVGWEGRMRNAIMRFRRAYAEEVTKLFSDPLSMARTAHRSRPIPGSALEQLHSLAEEVCQLWDGTRNTWMRTRFNELGNVKWNLLRDLSTAQVYDLIQ